MGRSKPTMVENAAGLCQVLLLLFSPGSPDDSCEQRRRMEWTA
jgi:hypothetical protein